MCRGLECRPRDLFPASTFQMINLMKQQCEEAMVEDDILHEKDLSVETRGWLNTILEYEKIFNLDESEESDTKEVDVLDTMMETFNHDVSNSDE